MYAKLTPTGNLRWVLRYNEEKVSQGKAEYLLAENFVKDQEHLTVEDKFDRFQQRNSLNDRVEGPMLHISINFNIGEVISNEKMQILAKRYLQGMGLENQPYLVYRHHDAAHTHLHIATTIIRADGSRLDIEPKDMDKSHRITRELEQEFSLVHYEKIRREESERFRVQQAQRAIYGQAGGKHAISDVLNTVVDHYKYTSLPEFNAILGLYNVKANRGKENSHLYKHRGLFYHVTDGSGKHLGKGIKASDFFLKPTLDKLEEKFVQNQSLIEDHRNRIKTEIDWALAGRPPAWESLRQELEREGISIVVQKERKGDPAAIFFVDHNAKCVFSGQSLGNEYLLESIKQKCEEEQEQQQLEEIQQQHHSLRL